MKEFIGVRSFTSALMPGNLKRDALAFKRIALPACSILMSSLNEEIDSVNELRWLFELGVIFEPLPPDMNAMKEIIARHKDDPFMSQIRELRKVKPSEVFKDEIVEVLCRENIPVDDETFSLVDLIIDLHSQGEYLLRPISVMLREHKQMDAYPVFAISPDELEKPKAEKNDIVQITLNAFPIPDDSVSWEEIVDYRSDPDTQGKFLALRNWMNEVAQAQLTPNEIEEKLEWLMYEYQRHLALHKMKTNFDTFETIVVAAADCLENLVKLNLGKAARGLFAFKHRRIELIEGELNCTLE
jgi:hypothetical protein